MSRIAWPTIIEEADRIARSYSTSVTLRQLHYRLVSAGVGYPNTQLAYKRLSHLTAKARREGTFPPLSDLTRSVARPLRFESVAAALDDLVDRYRRDRTEGQQFQVWVLFEKATLAAQITEWTYDYGLPTAALRGYSSESLERDIFAAMLHDGRPVVGFYVGDLDPEGEDIERNLLDQADRYLDFHHWERLTVTPDQVNDLELVEQPGKPESSRADGFIEKYGRLFQVEVEAVDPAVLERLVIDAVTDFEWFDADQWDVSQSDEADDIERLDSAKG